MPRYFRQPRTLCLTVLLSLGALASAFGEPPPKPARSTTVTESKTETAPQSKLLVDDGKLLFILTDRKVKVPEFFQRHRIVVGAIRQKDLDKLSRAKEPIKRVFLDYTSANDDPEKAGRYGDNLTLAPLSPDVAALIEKHAAPRKKTATGAST